jgi:hypothetical protein
VDWLSFLSIALVWLVFFFLFKNQKDKVRRRKSRDIRLRSRLPSAVGGSKGNWEWLGAYPEEAARRAIGKNFSPTLSLPPSHALDKVDAATDSGSSERSDG